MGSIYGTTKEKKTSGSIYETEEPKSIYAQPAPNPFGAFEAREPSVLERITSRFGPEPQQPIRYDLPEGRKYRTLPPTREEQPLIALKNIGGYYASRYITGRGLYLPDIITRFASESKSFSEALNKETGFVPTKKEEQIGSLLDFMGSIRTAGGLIQPGVAKLPIRALGQKVIGGGLTFGARATVEQAAKKITKDEPMSPLGIAFETAIGMGYGLLEGAVARVKSEVAYRRFIKAHPEAKTYPKKLLLRANEAMSQWFRGLSRYVDKAGKVPAKHRNSVLKLANRIKKIYGKDLDALFGRMHGYTQSETQLAMALKEKVGVSPETAEQAIDQIRKGVPVAEVDKALSVAKVTGQLPVRLAPKIAQKAAEVAKITPEPPPKPIAPEKPPTVADWKQAKEALIKQEPLGEYDEDPLTTQPVLVEPLSRPERQRIVAEVRENESDEAAEIVKDLLSKEIQTIDTHETADKITIHVVGLSQENFDKLNEIDGITVEDGGRVGGDYIRITKPAPEKPPTVAAEGKVYYHGTTEQGLKSITEKGAIPETEHPLLKRKGRGFFISRDIAKAKKHGDSIVQIRFKPNAKIATPENLGTRFFTEHEKGKLFNVSDVVKEAKKQGYDIVDLEAFHNLTKEPVSELVVLNSDAIESAAPAPEKPPTVAAEVTTLPISQLEFETPKVKEGVERSRGRVDVFKRLLRGETIPKTEAGGQFTKEDIVAPLEVEWDEKLKKYKVTEGNHRLKAYQELGIENVPVKIIKPTPTSAKPPVAKEPWEMSLQEFAEAELDKGTIIAEGVHFREKGQVVIAAFKNKKTGKVIETGAVHDLNKIPKGGFESGRWDIGFVEEGRFYGREAYRFRQAKEAHREIIRKALSENKPVPKNILLQYKSEKWAQEALAKPPVEKPPTRPGFVDLTPIANAGEQIKTVGEKAGKLVTRFGGVEKKVQKALIEYEEQLRELPKVAAKDAIKKFGKLTEQQERAIENYREQPDKYSLPEELREKYNELEQGLQEYGKRLEALGYPANWPDTYIHRLEKRLEKLKKSGDPAQEELLEKAIEEAKGLRYLHHQYQPSSLTKRARQWFRRRITKKPGGVLGRKIPTYEKAEELGLKRAPLTVSYAHMTHEIMRAEAASNLIKAINNNPNLSAWSEDAPEGWVYLDSNIFPESVQRLAWAEEGKPFHKIRRRKYPVPIAEALEELTYARSSDALARWYDKTNFALKIIGFYNPLVMSKNDLVQMWRATGTLKMLNPIVWGKAINTFVRKDAEYDKLRKAGLFNNVVNYTPAVKELTQQMLDKIRLSSGKRAAKIAADWLNPTHIMKDLRRFNEATTWNIDEIIRIATHESVKNSRMLKGLTEFEKIEWVNDALVNYAKLPKGTKTWLSRFFFVPTYRIGNFRFFWSQIAKRPWRFKGPLLRTVGYKMFVQWGLPAIVAAAIYWKTRDKKDVWTEKGYRIAVHNPETGKDTVYALADPLLEGAKITQRTFRHTFKLNLAAVPHLAHRILTGPQYKGQKDILGEYFKIGTPLVRDVVNWKDPDKKTYEKILTQLAIAYVYSRKHRPKDKEIAAEALAKTVSIWTNWKEQKEDVERMLGVKFYRLMKTDELRAELRRNQYQEGGTVTVGGKRYSVVRNQALIGKEEPVRRMQAELKRRRK